MVNKKSEIRFVISEVLNKKLNEYCDREGIDRIDIMRCAFFEKIVELGIINKPKKNNN